MSSVCGNIQGLKPAQLSALERLYKRRFSLDCAWSLEQARELAFLSCALGRQIGIMADRKGKVQLVIAGKPDSLYIPELPKSNSKKLRGLRLIHTHLGSEQLSQEDLMDLVFLRLDAIFSLGVENDGAPNRWQAAWLSKNKKETPYFVQPARQWHDCQLDMAFIFSELESGFESYGESDSSLQCALLVSVSTAPSAVQEDNLDELAKLAKTAGLSVSGRIIQRASRPNPKFILGKGKLAELEVAALKANADILVFDGELTPAQLHNLADITERKVIDRTQLILDIFSRNAVTGPGKLQVELAQLAYAEPRLAGSSKALDRLGGGIGGRGPGETRLETDRRKSRVRMAFLKKELDRLCIQRKRMRQRRARNGIPVAALVGYTNAGKSTLLNFLTKSDVEAKDQLFATLDPAVRKLRFPKEKEIVLSDTVGFIRNLPNELKDAFKATLEELESADLLLHIADGSSLNLRQQIEAVETVFEDLGLLNKPVLLVLNKCDNLTSEKISEIMAAWPNAVAISAVSGLGIEELLIKIENMIFKKDAEYF